MPVSERSAYNGWEAIDHIAITDCAVTEFAHLDKVPMKHAEIWAVIWVDIFEYLHAAHDDADVCPALKWQLLIHDLMLRPPPRGAAEEVGIAWLSHLLPGSQETRPSWYNSGKETVLLPIIQCMLLL